MRNRDDRKRGPEDYAAADKPKHSRDESTAGAASAAYIDPETEKDATNNYELGSLFIRAASLPKDESDAILQAISQIFNANEEYEEAKQVLDTTKLEQSERYETLISAARSYFETALSLGHKDAAKALAKMDDKPARTYAPPIDPRSAEAAAAARSQEEAKKQAAEIAEFNNRLDSTDEGQEFRKTIDSHKNGLSTSITACSIYKSKNPDADRLELIRNKIRLRLEQLIEHCNDKGELGKEWLKYNKQFIQESFSNVTKLGFDDKAKEIAYKVKIEELAQYSMSQDKGQAR